MSAEQSNEVQEVKEDIIDFVEDSDKKLKILKRIVEYEDNNEDNSSFTEGELDGCSWSPGSDVSMQPSYIGMFKSAPFIEVAFDSNKHTILHLKNLDAAKQAIEEIEGKPDEWSDEWINERVGDNKIDEALEHIEITDEDKEKIYQTTKEVDAIDYWSNYVCPVLKHRDRAKNVVLIVLASPDDKHDTKGRVNMLAYGPPGTGKSAIKGYLVDKFDVESIDGPRVSKADITYNKSNDQFGQLVKAHKGILVVEESDEMDEGPLGASLTSLGESGKIEIRDHEIPAEARGIFLSNFESVDHAIHQWSEESVNRFDFTIHFDRLDDEHKDEAIDWHYEYFRQPKPNENEELFLKYLKLVRKFDPVIDESEEIKEYRRDNIKVIDNVREGISVMNIAWIIARLNFSDVKLEHYKQAFDLVTSKK